MEAPRIFCEKGTALFILHLKECEECRTSIKTAIDQLPFISMFTDIKRLKEALDNIGKEGVR